MKPGNFIETVRGLCSNELFSAISTGYRACMESKDIQGLSPMWYKYEDLCEEIKDEANRVFTEYEFDAKVIRVELHGSRLRGTARDDSDLDAVLWYEGKEREDDVFNLLHDTDAFDMMFDGIVVDVNPIKFTDNDAADYYMDKSAAYDREVIRNSMQ